MAKEKKSRKEWKKIAKEMREINAELQEKYNELMKQYNECFCQNQNLLAELNKYRYNEYQEYRTVPGWAYRWNTRPNMEVRLENHG